MEAIGRMAGGIAHEFNNLLVGILGYGSRLARELDPDDSRWNMAKVIEESALSARDLTQRLLVFSRKQLLDPKVIDLSKVVSGLVKLLKPLLGEEIELITLFDPEASRVRVDPRQIEQVVFNLAANARDAMPKGGKLIIQTQNLALDEIHASRHSRVVPGPYVQLSVSDTGIGMDAETQAHLFEPFFTNKEPGKGTGLGLATAYAVITQSGGHFSVYSELGRGTTFKVYLPRIEAALDEVVGAELGPVQVDQLRGSETVLLVEDEAIVRRLTQETLTGNGYTVLEAQGGADALQKLHEQNGPIHLLLTDVVMPKMSGRELARRLGRSHPGIKVVYMSGYPICGIIENDAIKPGSPFIQKPFTPEMLLRAVREALDK
jgi:two-component system, cell cycle sensor histidine kinase and response regulator CckA